MTRYSSRTTLSSQGAWATGEGRIRLHFLLLTLYLFYSEWIGGILGQVHALKSYYSNVTLTSNNGDLSVVVYLPPNVKENERPYYESSRFDWGSIIGTIVRSSINPNTGEKETHTLYGANQWRLPHDPYWVESGVGLASEFGVGTEGSFCSFLCGWNQVGQVTNGILGYQEARSGESFLKIGVGELIKGSCNTCDSAEDYKFNSPYQFAKPPVWTLETDDSNNSIILRHEAVLDNRPIGYKIERHITLNDDQLLVKTFLSNLGSESFSTAWYSNHFFSCDARPVEYGYSLDFDLPSLHGINEDLYEEPTTWSWSTPLADYAKVFAHNNTNHVGSRNTGEDEESSVRIDIQRGIEAYVRIKAEFKKDEKSKGDFTVSGCNTKIRESIPEVGDGISGISMYAFNLYIESGTLSPEPQILLNLGPGETTSWTQQLDFENNYPIEPRFHNNQYVAGSLVLDQIGENWNPDQSRVTAILPGVGLVILLASIVYQSILAASKRTRGRKREEYHRLPDADTDNHPNHRENIESDVIRLQL